MEPTAAFVHRPDPDHPGWVTWDIDDPTRFNPIVIGRMIVRPEGPQGARLRMLEPRAHHGNVHGMLHGGVTLSLVDISLFATSFVVCGGDTPNSVTIDVACQFMGAGHLGAPVDAACEVLRETGRLIFLRGMIEQEGEPLASYSGTLRKPSAR